MTMTNLHTFWTACLHCPAVVVTGVSAVIVVFAAALVSMAAMGCMAQSEAGGTQPEVAAAQTDKRRGGFGCAADVAYVVF